MMAGTIPPGNPRVVQLRNELKSALFGPGHAQEFRKGRPFDPPTVVHEFGAIIPDAARIRVGWGDCATSLSPWSCPLLPGDYTAVAARQFIQTRCDAKEWLARLSGKELECDCKRMAECCWAHILRNACIEAFGNESDGPTPTTFAVAEDEHEEPDVLPFEVYVEVPTLLATRREASARYLDRYLGHTLGRHWWRRYEDCKDRWFGRYTAAWRY